MNVSHTTSFLINFILLFCSNNYRYFKSSLSNFAIAQEVELYVVDLDVKLKESTRYTDYKYDQDNDVERFTAKPGYLINGIFKGEKFITEAINDRYYYKVVIHPGADGKKKLTTIFPHEPEPEDIPQPYDPSAQVTNKPFVLNVRIKKSTEQFNYTYDEARDIERFTCKRGYLISKVMKGDKVVTEAINQDYYDRVVIHRGPDGNKKLSVLYPGEEEAPEIALVAPPEPQQVLLVELEIKYKQTNEYYKYKYDQINDLERFTARKGYLFSRIVRNGQQILEVTDGNYFDRVLIYRDAKNKRQMTTLFPGEEELVSVNLRERENTDEFTYKFDPYQKREKFTCNEGFLIYRVTKGTEFITQVSDNNYYDRAIIEKDPAGGKKLTLLYPNDIDIGDPEEPYPAYKIAKGLVPAEKEIGVDLADAYLERMPGISVVKKPTKDPVHIDLDIFKDCDLYHVKKHGFQGISIITARPGFGFKEVHYGPDTIWNFDKCKKSTDHPHKIVMKETRNEKNVAIVFENDYYVYRKPKHQTWQDLSDRRYDLTRLKFYKGNPNNLDTLVELERHDYTVGTRFITIEYKFNPGVECTEIRYDRHVIWRYINRFPKAFHLNMRLNTFIIVFDIRTYVVLNVPGP